MEYSLRSEEHTSELQSHLNLVCRLLLEKKKRCVWLVSGCGDVVLFRVCVCGELRCAHTARADTHKCVSTCLLTQHQLMLFFFFNESAAPEYLPFSLPGALPI